MLKILSSATVKANPEFALPSRSLHVVDIVIIAIYLGVMSGIAGLFWWISYKKKLNGSNYFFTGGGKNPIIIVGLSMFATIVSSLGLLNVPGLSFTSRWMWSGINIALISATPFIAIWIVPFYRRIKESTAYAFLEKRFHYSVRALSSISFILYQVFRVAIVLFVPITALSIVVDINEYIWIVVVGLVVILTTTIGGFKAVIWSDAVQGLVFLLGIFSVIIAALIKTDWGSDTKEIHAVLIRDSWKVNKLQAGIALIFLYNIINTLHAFMGSQDVTQRYKGTKSVGQVRKTLYVAAIMNAIMTLLFFGAGAALYTYYTSKGFAPTDGFDGIHQGLKNNGFLVYSVVLLLPVGMVGFFIASVFAASQSTISSGLSALSNSIVVDFIQRFRPNISEKKITLISKLLVLVFGLLAIAFGSLLIFIKQDNLFGWFAGVVGLFNAPMVAVFLLGIFTLKANWRGTFTGFLIGFILAVGLWLPTQQFIPEKNRLVFDGVYQVLVSFIVTLFISWISSLLFNKFHKATIAENKLKVINRTIWSRSHEFKTITTIEAQMDKLEKWRKKGLVDAESITFLENKMVTLQKTLDQQQGES